MHIPISINCGICIYTVVYAYVKYVEYLMYVSLYKVCKVIIIENDAALEGVP